ncbi:RNA polymerase sigma factor [Bacillus taeanensis]|uniref:RNA polymerase sigma factor n=1 Tax=Bacillus taeanensis TaxID=273032 RepID=UPI0015F08EFD|nr:RNA polymerase sigma factor [Bacillus taeanensis]
MGAVLEHKENQKDVGLIYRNYYMKVYHAALSVVKDCHIAEDVVQETFIKAYKNIEKMDEECRIGSWLSTIAVRTAIDFVRKEKRSGAVPVESIILELNEDKWKSRSVEKEVEQLFLKEDLLQFVGELKPELGEILLLKFQKGLKEEEIARYMKLPLGTVKSRIYRGRNKVKDYLLKQYVS